MGELETQGNEQNPVVFTSDAWAPNLADWSGVSFKSSSAEDEIKYWIVEYANKGITSEREEIEFKSSAFNTCNYGLLLENIEEAEIKESKFTGCKTSIYLENLEQVEVKNDSIIQS